MFDLHSLVISGPRTVMCLNDVLYIKSSRQTFLLFGVFVLFYVLFLEYCATLPSGFLWPQAGVCRTGRAVSAPVSGRRSFRMTNLLALCLIFPSGALCLVPGGLNSLKLSH